MSDLFQPLACPHCGAWVALTKGICPACRRDAGDLQDAESHRKAAQLRKAVQELISQGKSQRVIRAVLQQRGEAPERTDAELRAQSAHYRSAAGRRGTWSLLGGTAAILFGIPISIVLISVGWTLLAFGCMHLAWGLHQWRQSRHS